jgi:hypothetical protein
VVAISEARNQNRSRKFYTFLNQLMNTRSFVSGSSVILLAWLGATFLNEVPTQRYPRLDKKAASAQVIHSQPVVILGAKTLTR